MINEISVIGGDLRIVKLVNLLQNQGIKIKTYGLEKSEDISNNVKIETIEECVYNNEVVISSVPFSKDGNLVNAPFSNSEIKISELLEKLKGKKLVAGNLQNIKLVNKDVELLDILKNEELTIMNAIPSAEGAIQVAMEQSPKTIHGSNTLILGFGRIGKILSKMLNGLGAKVYCEARKDTDLAWINAYGYNSINLKDLKQYLNKFDIIFNTIPYTVLNKECLELIDKNCIIIDLASKPGGVDFTEAEKLNLKTFWALGLPGKVAPETAAEYIKNAILKNI